MERFCKKCNKNTEHSSYSSGKPRSDNDKRIKFVCLVCQKKRSRESYLRNKEHCNKKSKEYFLLHREKIRKYTSNYNKIDKNKKKALERAKATRNKKSEFFWGTLKSFNAASCRVCGYDKSTAALQVHHLFPSQKDNYKDNYAVWLRGHSFEYFKRKLYSHNFIILCANCHSELHAGLIALDGDHCWNDSNYFVEEI